MEAKELSLGMQLSYTRQISIADIQAFTKASNDAGIHHVQADASGRLIAHGLLVASLVTKIGGDLNYLARTMQFDFKKPAYSGDTLTCVGTLDAVIEQSERFKCKFSFTITNQSNEVVMVGESSGMIRK